MHLLLGQGRSGQHTGATAGEKGSFDYILVETTGMANPGPLASMFWVDDALESRLKLDGIVTLVDCKHVHLHVHDDSEPGACNETQLQIAYADRILLNKTDLVSEVELNATVDMIRKINSVATVTPTVRSNIDVNTILGIRAFDADRLSSLAGLDAGIFLEQVEADTHCAHQHSDKNAKVEMKNEEEREHATSTLLESHGAQAHHTHRDSNSSATDNHVHSSRITSVVLSTEHMLSLSQVDTWAANLLWEKEAHGMEIFRMKGIFAIRGSNTRHIFQAVHELFDCEPMRGNGGLWLEGQQRVSRVVVIGRDLNKTKLMTNFGNLVPTE